MIEAPRKAAAILPQISPSRGLRLFPVIFFLAYLGITILMFAFGPWEWPVQDGTKLYLFLALAHLALFFGYLSAAFRNPCGYSNRFPVYKLIRWVVLINLGLLIPTSVFRTGSAIPDVRHALDNLGSAYSDTMNLRNATTPTIEYIRLVFGPLTALLLPLTIFYWRFIRPFYRLAALVVIAGTVAIFIAMGTNKAIADTVVVTPFILIAAHKAGIQRLRLRRLLIGGILSACAFVGFLWFFSSAMSSRLGSNALYGTFRATGTRADPDNLLIKYSPPVLQLGTLQLDAYLTQGYYALYLSLDEPFVPMFGVGNSTFLTRQVARIADNEELMHMSYPARIEKHGWDQFGLWSSIYPWLASDLSFPGTIIVIFFIGRLFALSWLDTLDGTNPFAVGVFAQFLIMLFYFPANNQLIQSGEGVSGFIGLLLLWAFTRRRYSQKQPFSFRHTQN